MSLHRAIRCKTAKERIPASGTERPKKGLLTGGQGLSFLVFFPVGAGEKERGDREGGRGQAI